MKKPYLAWWFPGFDNPDKTSPIGNVSLCTVDNQIRIYFNNKIYDHDKVDKLERAYRRLWETHHCFCTEQAWDSSYNILTFGYRGGTRITLDKIADEVGVLEKLDPSLDFSWFRKQLEQQKKMAGLPEGAPSDYDLKIMWNEECLLKRITCSKYGGTIELRDEPIRNHRFMLGMEKNEFHGLTGDERKNALAKIKTDLLKMPTEDVTFTVNPNDPNQIHFRWDVPMVKVGNERAEYISLLEILPVIEKVTDISKDIASLKYQSMFL